MIAAIYARKSTEQKGVSKDEKSVAVQAEAAQEFAVKQGWTVNPAHIFIDDKISGAEFERRPAFMRLMSTLTPKPPFQVLIVRELARLGREASETGYVIKQLAQAGVEIVEYLHGKSLTPKNWLEKAMSAVESAADEAHREKSSELVHVAHTRKHKAGYVVGGRVFGYRNVDVFIGVDDHGRPLRSHVERIIDPVEAAVVQRIFELYDSGLGLKRIAILLNTEGAVKPKPFHDPNGGLRPTTGGNPSTVRSVLARTTYHGEVIWKRRATRMHGDNAHRLIARSQTGSRAPMRICASSMSRCGYGSRRGAVTWRRKRSDFHPVGSAAVHRSTPPSTCSPVSPRAGSAEADW